MKKINISILLSSFILLVLACSALSMSAVMSEYRFTWVAMNPWNGVEGVALTIGHYLHIGKSISTLITLGVLSVTWWRIYALLCSIFIRENKSVD